MNEAETVELALRQHDWDWHYGQCKCGWRVTTDVTFIEHQTRMVVDAMQGRTSAVCCWTCADKIIAAKPWPENLVYPFIICSLCGNKRCPHAEDHELECTKSNEPGQAGAVRYGGAPNQPKRSRSED